MHRINICLCILIFFALVASASARQVDVTWQMQGGETLDQGKQRAMEKGWAKAVFLEALELLPGELTSERREVLRQYLAPHAERFILESSETRLSESVDGMHLGLEVLVDSAALRQLLQRIGVFYTAGAVLPYSLVLADVPGVDAQAAASASDNPAAATTDAATQDQETVSAKATGSGSKTDIPSQIARLELLTGLERVQGAMPRVQFSLKGNTWKGRIETSSGGYDVAGSDLETLWLSLWGWYFTVHGPDTDAPADSGELLNTELVVEGWPGPGGVYEFEEILKGFRPALARATLKTLALRPGGVRGVWQLSLRDPAAFRSRLEAYMQGRGLTWEIDGVPADAGGSVGQESMPPTPSAAPGADAPAVEQAPSGQQQLPPDSSAPGGPSSSASSTPLSSAGEASGWQSVTPLPRAEELPTSSREVH